MIAHQTYEIEWKSIRRSSRRICSLCVLIFYLAAITGFIFPSFLIAEQAASPLNLSSVADLRKKLSQECTMLKQNMTSYEILREIGNVYGVQVWCDRRLDPDRVLQFRVSQKTVEGALDQLATQMDAEVVWVENILYFAPKGEGAKIEAAYWKLFQIWPLNKRKAGEDFEWPELSSPSQIIADLAKKSGVAIEGTEDIPHDLWKGGKLTDCSIAAKLSLMLAGFDRTLVLEKQKLKIVPTSPEIEVSARTVNLKVDPTLLKSWQSKWPSAQAKNPKGAEWILIGPPQAHRELLRPPLTKSVPPKNGKSAKKISGRLQGLLGELLTQLAEAEGALLDPNPLPEKWHRLQVDLEVKDVTMDELFGQLGTHVGLTITKMDKTIRVR